MAAHKTISNHDRRMELTEHLGELRSRIIRSLWYLVIGAIIGYQFFAPFYAALYKPLQQEIAAVNKAAIERDAKKNSAPGPNGTHLLAAPRAVHDPPTMAEFNALADYIDWCRAHPILAPLNSSVFHDFFEMFTVRVTCSILFGFILVLPLVVWEFAMFITPALTLEERRPLRLLVPLSVLLLVSGIVVAYATMFGAMGWFLGYLENYGPDAVLMQDPASYILFFVKMMACFGVAFQLPVVLAGGAFMEIVTSKGLIRNWRWGVMTAILGGVLTPGNDPMSWVLMVVPLLILYFGSIPLVRYVEKLRAKSRKA